MRRSDREITDRDGLIDIIGSCSVCRLGMAKDNIPYVVPMSFGYVYDQGILTLFFHCAKEGKKLEYLRSNPIVCFEMDSLDQFIIGENACSCGMSYKSVIGTGTAEFITDEQEKIDALRLITFRYTGNRDLELMKGSAERTAVFKVVSREFTGKQS